MPQVAAAVASAITYVSSASAAVTAGSATLAQTLTVAAVNIATSAALTAASALLSPSVGVGGNPTDWTADPDAPLRYAIGRGGAAGQIVHRDEYGPDNMFQTIVAAIAAGGPIKAFVGYEFDDQPVTFGAGGAATSSQWVGEMWLTTRLGAQPDTALTSPAGLKNGATLPGWTSASKLSGKAAYMLTMAENSKRTAFPTGEPKPLITWEGGYGWDPRQDSTYPGGSGPCRLNDPATYVWIDNPALGALKWALGFWEGPSSGGKYGVPHGSVLVGGFGSKVEGIDVASFVEAANVADVNGWTVAAYPSSADNKAQVMDALLQACGAVYAERAGKISCIHRAAPRASVVTISAADTAGPLELDTTVSRIGRINTIRPRYWSEANRWQMTAADAVSATAYVTEDGGERRTRGVDFPFVRDVQQAAELAALQLANTREGFRGVIPLKPHLQRIRPGDAFTITEPGFILDGQKCLCLDTEFDAATGVHRVTFVSEADGKYDFAFGLSPEPPEPATLSPNPGAIAAPLPDEWTIVPRPPAADGTQLPGFDLSGIVGSAKAYRVLVEYALDDEGPWVPAYEGPPTSEEISITVPAGGVYYVGIIYFDQAGVPSARTVYGPFTAAGLAAGLDPAQFDALNLRAADQIASDIANALKAYNDTVRRKEEIRAESEARRTAINVLETTVEEVATDLEAEIVTRTDQISALNGQVASVSSATTTNATNISAVASRATVLEAQVQNPTTGLLSRATSLESRVTTVETDKASAASVSTLSATVGGLSSTVTGVSSVAADAQGKVNAVVGVTLDVNGKISGTRQANNGATSLFDIQADAFRVFNGASNQPVFQVTGGQVLIANSRVATESMVANAVTDAGVSFTAGDLTLSGTTQVTTQTLVFACSGRPVVVRSNFYMTLWHPPGGGFSVTVRVLRNGVAIFEIALDAINGDQITGWQTPEVEDVPGAGTHTYTTTVQLSRDDGFSIQRVQSRAMRVQEFKR